VWRLLFVTQWSALRHRTVWQVRHEYGQIKCW
jgi:hypothetical protein